MNAADNPQIKILFDVSAKDEQTLAFPVPNEIFGFHLQQAVEKLYKALITAHGEEHPFTHNLQTLHDKLTVLGEQPPALGIELGALSEYAVEFRYTIGPEFSGEERTNLRASIEALRQFATRRCEELKQANVQVKTM